MALQTQVIGIDFTQGLARKRDSKLIVPGKLTRLDNGEFDSSDTISKRTGFSSISTVVSSGGNLPNTTGDNVISELAGESVVVGGGHLYGRAEASAFNKWIDKGSIIRTGVQLQRIGSSTTVDQRSFDQAINASGTYSCVVWEEGGSLKATVFDEVSGNAVMTSATVGSGSSGTTRPKVTANNNRFQIYWASGTDLKFRYIDVAVDPTTFAAAESTLVAAGLTSQLFDVAFNSTTSTTFVIYYGSAGTRIRGLTTDSAGTIVTAATDILVAAPVTLCAAIFGSGKVLVAHWDGTNGLRATTCTTAFGSIATVTINASTTTVRIITAISDASTTAIVLAEYKPTTSRFIESSKVTDAAALSSGPGTLARAVGIATRPFTDSSTQFVGVVQEGETATETKVQSTAFLIRVTVPTSNTTPLVVGKCLVWRSGGVLSSQDTVPNVIYKTATRIAQLLFSESGRVQFFSGRETTKEGVTRASFYFNPNASGASFPLQIVEHEGLLRLAGAAPQIYDGISPVEDGYHLYPIVTATASGTAGSLSAGSYQYAVVYEWTDGQGNLHRSVPSVAVSSTSLASKSTDLVLIPLNLTQKTSPRQEISIVVYRTTANGTIFYRLVSVSNAPFSATVTLSDGTGDTSITSNEPLYTTGSVLYNTPAPPHRVACVHQSRRFVAGLENPYEFRYTKSPITKEAAGFNEVLIGTVPPDFGIITGLASQDDKLIIFCERRPFYIIGEGPNDKGEQNGYALPQPINADVGCRADSPNSIISTLLGTWMRSARGIRLLGRSLEIERIEGVHVGADTDVDLSSSAIVAALQHPTKSQFWFYDGNNVLVYDYEWNQWSKFTNHLAASATLKGKALPMRLTATGSVFLNDGSATDDSTPIALTLETGWLHFAGVQGFQRLYKLLILGIFKAASTFSLEYGFNYATSYSTPKTFDTTGLTPNEPLQLRNGLAQQKCEAMRFRISESGGTGAGFTLTNFSLEAGLKQGAFKLGPTKTI